MTPESTDRGGTHTPPSKPDRPSSARERRSAHTRDGMSLATRTLYHPVRHVWLRRAGRESRRREGASMRRARLELGLTARGLEDVGDVSSVRVPSRLFVRRARGGAGPTDGAPVRRGDELLRIEFDGYRRSGADELYHAVWESYAERMSIASPVSGRIRGTDSDVRARLKHLEIDGFDEDTVLVGIDAAEEEWDDVREGGEFVDRSTYLETIGKRPRGIFY